MVHAWLGGKCFYALRLNTGNHSGLEDSNKDSLLQYSWTKVLYVYKRK